VIEKKALAPAHLDPTLRFFGLGTLDRAIAEPSWLLRAREHGKFDDRRIKKQFGKIAPLLTA
jgi:hypothetical protein